MTNESKDIDSLRQGYRRIKAPPHLATRIRAEVADQPIRSHSWMPAGATVMAVALVALMVPFFGQQSVKPATVPSKPSLSALAALKPDAPPATSVSLSKLRTVKKPKLPAKPILKTTKPQTHLNLENNLLEEKDHVHS